MPLYDYRCPHCDHAFEELRPLAERASAPCPQCGRKAEKQISSFFTGSSGSSTPPPSCGPAPGGG